MTSPGDLVIPVPRDDRPFDAVALGLNAIDLIVEVPRFPERNAKTELQSLRKTAGGQAATAMVTVARLGGRARYLGKFGDDDHGVISRSTLEAEGIDVSRAHTVEGTPNQFAVVLVESPTGTRTIVWRRDEALENQPEEIAETDIASARVLLLDGHDLPACLRAADLARTAGAPVVLDAERIFPQTEELLTRTDVVLAAEAFPAAFTGRTDPLEALETILALGPRVAGMTRGARGALLLTPEGPLEHPGFPVEAVDTTGAGDVFHGAFAFALARGWPLGRTLSFSNACAALNCTRLGGRDGIPDLDTVEAFLQRHDNSPP